jgi:ferric-dicitrate binding protein FerR (iron transport regulator)
MNEMPGNGESGASRDPLAELVRVGGHRMAPPRADYEQVLAAATAGWQRAVHARRRRRWIGALAASAAACAIGLVLLQLRPLAVEPVAAPAANLLLGDLDIQRPGAPGWSRLRPGAAIENGARLRANGPLGASISLSAGRLVRLKPATQVTLLAGAHLQLVAGNAYVDSGTQQPADSIVIDTGLGTVRDIGTVFEVQAAPEAIRIRVREGRVLLDASGRATPLESHAGEELRLARDGSTLRASIPTAGPEWAWAEALAMAPAIDGQSLLGFLEWVAHECGRPLQFQSDGDKQRAAAVLLHGSVPDLRPLDALDIMLAATDFEYTLSDAGAIVIHRRAL